jgi:hypothetical protein
MFATGEAEKEWQIKGAVPFNMWHGISATAGRISREKNFGREGILCPPAAEMMRKYGNTYSTRNKKIEDSIS